MSAITGRTRLLGVMGWPVEHSRSPIMHAAAIQAAGLDYAYVPLAVAPEKLAEAVRGLAAMGFRGSNVTIPHKVAVAELMDELSPAARQIGAVNTIVVEPDGRLRGENTDAYGAFGAIKNQTGRSAQGRDVLVIGAGGAARAAACGAAERGAQRVILLNRTREKAEALAHDFAQSCPETEFAVIDQLAPGNLAPGAFILQMTSLGMKGDDPLPADPGTFPKDAVVLEAVYAPPVTPFLQACRANGLRTVDGLAMLVAQGARSLEIWTEATIDREVMREALES
ncbi:shikimate dehydrogenase [bacterium]|nr:shikimate dehydrogenase [bacterium]